MTLSIHNILPCSNVNGPGERTVIWTQGCSLHCKGCFNENTHSFSKRILYEPKNLAEEIASYGKLGITISGGEPLDQPYTLIQFLTEFKKKSDATIFMFTGYTVQEILFDKNKVHAVKLTDAALCGRYKEGNLWESKRLMQITGRIKPQELMPTRQIELISESNKFVMTGYPERINTRRDLIEHQ